MKLTFRAWPRKGLRGVSKAAFCGLTAPKKAAQGAAFGRGSRIPMKWRS